MNYNTFNVKKLKEIINDNNIEITSRSGKNGNIIKIDYLTAINNWKNKYTKYEFKNKSRLELIYLIYDLDIDIETQFYTREKLIQILNVTIAGTVIEKYNNLLNLNIKELLFLINNLDIKIDFSRSYTRKKLIQILKMYKHKKIKEILSDKSDTQYFNASQYAEMFNIPLSDNYDDIYTHISFSINKTGDRISKFPPEILAKILSPLELSTIQNFCKTNKVIAKSCNDSFWRQIIRSKLKLPGIFYPGTWINLISRYKLKSNETYTNKIKLAIDDYESNKKYQGILSSILKNTTIGEILKYDNDIFETIWKKIAKEKLKIFVLGTYKSWEILVKLNSYDKNDLYTLWNTYKYYGEKSTPIFYNGKNWNGKISSKLKYKYVIYKDKNYNFYHLARDIYYDIYIKNIDTLNNKNFNFYTDIIDPGPFVYFELSDKGITFNLYSIKDSITISKIYIKNYQDLINGYED